MNWQHSLACQTKLVSRAQLVQASSRKKSERQTNIECHYVIKKSHALIEGYPCSTVASTSTDPRDAVS